MEEVTAARRDLQRSRHLRQRRQQDVGGKRSGRRERGEHRDLQEGRGDFRDRRGVERNGLIGHGGSGLLNDVYHIKQVEEAAIGWAGMRKGRKSSLRANGSARSAAR